MLDSVRALINSLQLPNNARIVVALSGGPDSTALLYAIKQISEEFCFAVSAATYDHQLRSAAELAQELSLIQKHCSVLDIELHLGRAAKGEIQATARDRKIGLEAAARAHRYEFLHGIASSFGYTHIGLGHNRNDRLETQVQRFCQGSGPAGLIGITPVNGLLIRPLLDISREEIIGFLNERDISYSIDSTNADYAMLRNEIRGSLVPAMSSIFPGLERSLESMSEKMELVTEYLAMEAKAKIPSHFDSRTQEVIIPSLAFNNAHPILKYQSLMDACDRISAGAMYMSQRIPYRSIRPILVAGDLPVGEPKTLLQTNNVEIVATRNALRVRRHVVFDDENSYLMVINSDDTGTKLLKIGEYELQATVLPNQNTQSEYLAIDGYPAIIRSKRPGDYIDVRGSRSSVKSLISGSSIVPEHRWCVPVVQVGIRIIAVLGAPFGGRNWIAEPIAGDCSDSRGFLQVSVKLKVEI